MGHESFYWQSADRILSQVRAHRQTVVTPENVGGSSDVLYSSAGNVREDMYHTYGIYAFGWEVGGSVYNPVTGNFVAGSFQPPWVGRRPLSGHDETMEYANGVMEMFRIAADWGRDKQGATSSLVPGNGFQSDSPIGVRFEMNEPATIYYTTDGIAADAAVPALQPDGVPRAGRDPVGREHHDVQVVLRRRRGQRREQLRPGEPGDAGQLPQRHDQHRRGRARRAGPCRRRCR